MNLQKAFVISVVSHFLIFAPLGGLKIFSLMSKKEADVQINYYRLKPLKIESVKLTTKNKIAEAEKAPPPFIKEKPQQVKKESKYVEVKEIEQPQKKEELVKAPGPKKGPPKPRPEPARKELSYEAIPGTTLPNTPECQNYYLYIREKIRRQLEKEYKYKHGEGMVAVAFVLSRWGELSEIKILKDKSIGEPIHYRLAYESLKGAAPFKAFPEEVNLSRISFNLTVVFKEK